MAFKKPVERAKFNLGNLEDYQQGFTVPEGDYIFKDINVVMFEGFGEKKFDKATLTIMIDLVPLGDPTAEVRQVPYGLGKSADLSWAPNPEDGKSIVPVEGGPGNKLTEGTNWIILLKSLYDAGLPAGVFTDDVTPLIGLHAHMMNVPPPAERTGFGGTSTGESAGAPKKPRDILIVSEIKDDGKPWEGTGGIPEDKPKKGVVGKPAPKSVKPAAKKEPEPEPEGGDDEAIMTAAVNAVAAILEKNPKGLPKLALKTQVFSHVKKSEGDDMAQAVQGIMQDDDSLTAILEQFQYVVKGVQVVAIP
jgi:hypothetical protein